jgi:heptose I phosphotransferase
MLELPQKILKHLSEPAFEHLMALEGKVYRKQEKRQTEEVLIGGQSYFIKKHFGITLKEFIKNITQGRMPIIGARKEWLAIQALTKMGIATTPLVGYGKSGMLPFTQRSFVLTKALQNTVSLEELCQSWAVSPPNFRLKLKLITEVARIARCLHQHNYYHRDFYLCHFLVQEDRLDTLHLIDLHRMHNARIFKQRWQVKDLAALLFSALDIGLTQRDVLRFLSVYTKQPIREVMKNHILWRRVAERAVQLYFKAYQCQPKQKWLRNGAEVLPEKPGEIDVLVKLQQGCIKAKQCLRVLPKRRWVLLGSYQEQKVLLKIFAEHKHFQQEKNGSELLEKHNISTPKLIKAEQLPCGKYVVIYQYLVDAKAVQELDFSLISIFAKMHACGIKQKDCHLDNFIKTDGKLYVVDCASIKGVAGPLPDKQALDNLALLFAQKPAYFYSKQQKLWQQYQHERGWSPSSQLDKEFAGRVQAQREYRLRKWSKKIFRNCTAFRCKKRFDKYFCIDKKIANLYSQTLCEYPEAYFHLKSDYLKQGGNVTVVRTKLDQDDIVIKRYNLKNWQKSLRRLITPSKATRAWHMAHVLQANDVDVPEPLAFFERRLGPLRRQSYFVSAYCPGERLDQYLQQDLSDSELRSIAEAITDIMQKLKSIQCYHGDLKASNFIWDGKKMWLLDFDGSVLFRAKNRYKSMREKDWARLYRNWPEGHVLRQHLQANQGRADG